MTVAITIGCYKLTSFIELNVLRCRRIFGEETPILLSDDRSDASKDIQALALKYDCNYYGSNKRRSHFSGDCQAVINAIVFGRECGADIALKLSQRLIIVRPEFRTAMERAFADPEVQIALPGRIPKNQISRPSSVFYSRFGLLSDVVAIRPNAIEPEEFLSIYRDRCAVGKHPAESFVETSLGFILDKKFGGNKHRLVTEWSVHKQGQPKIYLRKSQSSSSDYQQIAMHEDVHSPTGWDLSEWKTIEGRNYRPKADCV